MELHNSSRIFIVDKASVICESPSCFYRGPLRVEKSCLGESNLKLHAALPCPARQVLNAMKSQPFR